MDALELNAASKIPHLVKPALRVLVIDDDDCVGAAIQAILGRHQFETELTSRAHSGIHAFEASRFDVVMVDLFLPGMTGLDTISHIRRRSAVPIVAISGFRLRSSLDHVDYLSMAMERGATASMRKPFTPPQLMAAINQSMTLIEETKQ
jgi:DNA-binding response OmpR family regulator